MIGNALKFRKHDEPLKIYISNKENNKYVFSMSDNGIGIELQYIDQIFNVFKKLYLISKYSRIGVELPIVKKIVERHCGYIWVESNLEEWVNVPLQLFKKKLIKTSYWALFKSLR